MSMIKNPTTIKSKTVSMIYRFLQNYNPKDAVIAGLSVI
jgi:hypothetical protein